MIWFEHIKEVFKSRENLKKVLRSYNLYEPDDYSIDLDGRILISNIKVHNVIHKGKP